MCNPTFKPHNAVVIGKAGFVHLMITHLVVNSAEGATCACHSSLHGSTGFHVFYVETWEKISVAG